MRINFGRVLLGGLVAGLILTIGEYVLNDIVLARQMGDTFLQGICSVNEGRAASQRK